jgi:hypothetical protein
VQCLMAMLDLDSAALLPRRALRGQYRPGAQPQVTGLHGAGEVKNKGSGAMNRLWMPCIAV